MKMIVKRPGKVAVMKDGEWEEIIHDCIGDIPGFALYSKYYGIGMYFNDSGYYSGTKANFCWENHFVYGPVVFVGLDPEGNRIDLTKLQIQLINDFLDKESVPG